MAPCSRSHAIARLAVVRATPNMSVSSFSEGTGWPGVAATILSRCGPDEWELVIEDERATSIEDGAGEDGRCYPIVFRDGSEIRLPGPTVEELRQVFFEEHGGTP